MTVQERKERARIKKQRQIVKRRITLLVAALIVITVGSIVCGSIFSSAKNPATDIPQHKYYKSIIIEKGDSLWSIAQEYRTDAYKDIQEYMDELIQLNGLTSRTIHEGQHLVIAYYDAEIR